MTLSIFVQILTLYPIIGAICWTVGGIFYRTIYVGKFLDKDFCTFDLPPFARTNI